MTKRSQRSDEPFLSNLDVAQSVDLVRAARKIADALEGEGIITDAKIIRALADDYIREKALPLVGRENQPKRPPLSETEKTIASYKRGYNWASAHGWEDEYGEGE